MSNTAMEGASESTTDWSSLDSIGDYVYYPSLPYSEYLNQHDDISSSSSSSSQSYDFGLHNGGNDIYYRQAKTHAYRARSAYKLLQIDMKYNIFSNVYKAVDLCSAPGSWSQVLVEKLYLERNMKPPPASIDTDSQLYTYEKRRHSREDDLHIAQTQQRLTQIVSIDIQEMAPLDGVHVIQGDITQQAVAKKIVHCFTLNQNDNDNDNHMKRDDGSNESHLVDLVICDAAPDVSGIHEIDEYMHHTQLLLAAFNITSYVLKHGGTFIAKIFKAQHSNNNYELLSQQYRQFFDSVEIYKPYGSRPRSAEHFFICRGYMPPLGYTPQWNAINNASSSTTNTTTTSSGGSKHNEVGKLNGDIDRNEKKLNNVIRYMSTGDLNWYESDEGESGGASDTASAAKNNVTLSSFLKDMR